MADDDNRTDDERKKQAADDEQKRITQAEDDRKAREQAEADRQKAMKETPLVPNDQGIVMVEAIMGPYRGQRLQMKEADGTAAINEHWARNPVWAEYVHDELSDEERKAAWDASHAWANAQWEEAQKEPEEAEPKAREREEQGGDRPPEQEQQRNLQADQGGAAAGYKTRTPEPPRRGR
jgi:hypothetical protein